MNPDIEVEEGVVRNEEIFDLTLPDSEVVIILNQRIKEAEAHWYGNKEWNLLEVAKSNKDLWLPHHLVKEELYRHESDYQDPRIFVATETLISQANARVANPEVSPGSESKASLQLSKDTESVVVAWARIHNMKKIQRQVTRGVFLNRHAYAHLYYDEDYGKNGDICVEYVPGTEVLVDPDAKEGEIPRFFIRNKKNTVQELLLKFPDAKKEILAELSMRGVKTQMGKIVAYRECWFQYYDENDYCCYGVAYKLNQTIMGKMKNPNWNETGKNFIPKDMPPFIPLNFLNTGESYIDHTTLIEQAKAAQKLLNKRGKQAVEVTDQASGGLIFNSQMISKKEGQKLTGHPKEKVFVNGDVRSAVVRLAPADISPGIIADKEDARASIDNTFGTHAPTRGDASGNATLGQDVLQTQKDLTRNDELIRSIDQFFHDFFNYLLQMMTVWYTDEHWFNAVGEDGKFDRIAMTSDKIEDGCSISVEPGSTLPIDKKAMRETGLALAKMQLTDPLSLFEDLGLPNPPKRLARLLDWLQNPQKLVQDADDEDFDRKAFMDITVLLSGGKLEVRKDINDRYIKFFNYYIKENMDQLKPEQQKALADYLQKEVKVLEAKLTLEESQLPTQDEMNAGNQQAVDQANQAAQVMKGMPQDPASAALAGAPAQAPGTPPGGDGSQTPTGQPGAPQPRGTAKSVQQMPQTPAATPPVM